MFNPEGVKGKTAQPPHNFFKIMTNSPAFTATFSIYDAATRIELGEFKTTVWNRSEYRATLAALRRAESYTLAMSRQSIAGRYGLTAKQLKSMLQDGVVARCLNFYKVEMKEMHLDPNPPKRVGEKIIAMWELD